MIICSIFTAFCSIGLERLEARLWKMKCARYGYGRTRPLGVPGNRVHHSAFLDEIYQAIKRDQGVTLKGFGGFFVRPERESWVFKFNPCQKWRALFGWSSTYKGEL